MKNIIKISLIILVFSSCDKPLSETEKCNYSNPLEEIEWLIEMKNTFETDQESNQKIIQYDYKNEKVFYIIHCDNCPDATTSVLNCQKETICQFGGIAGMNTCPNFTNEASNKKVLYSD